MHYLALLRGINVGGHGRLRMSDLKACCEAIGLTAVRTYIQSGNVLFAAPQKRTTALATTLESAIEKQFGFRPGVAVFTEKEWLAVVTDAPAWWGRDADWKHNLIALLRDTSPDDVIAAMNPAKDERVAAGIGVVYQSVASNRPSPTSSDRLGRHSIGRRVTVRNRNTTMKLAQWLADAPNE